MPHDGPRGGFEKVLGRVHAALDDADDLVPAVRDAIFAAELETLEAVLPATLDTAETATVFRVTPKTVLRWRREGKLHGLPPAGRGYLFTRNEVLALLFYGAGLLLVAFTLLAIACRAGFGPARDAMSWLTHGHPVCAEHPRRVPRGALYALPASKPPPAFAVLYDELDDELEAA